jgi:hypothetical protein
MKLSCHYEWLRYPEGSRKGSHLAFYTNGHVRSSLLRKCFSCLVRVRVMTYRLLTHVSAHNDARVSNNLNIGGHNSVADFTFHITH